MDIKNVAEILKSNGVAVNSNYVHALQDGCIKEYQTLLDNIVEKVEEFARFGVNGGFSKDLKENIEKLTNLAVKITDQKNGKKVSKFNDELSKIEKETTKLMEKNPQSLNVVEEVVKYIDSYTKGANTLTKMSMAESRKGILYDSIQKLGELKTILQGVADVSTTTAGDYAKKIITDLKEWSKKVSQNMHDSNTVALIDNAINSANSWTKVKVGVSTGLFKKSNKLTSLDGISFVKDDMYMIASSEGYVEQINIFSDNLKEYKETVEGGKYSTESDEKDLENKRDEIKNLNAKKMDIIAQLKNGEISKVEALEICKEIDYDVSDLNRDVNELTTTIRINKAGKRTFERVIKKLERINKVVLTYKNEPVMLSFLGQQFNFDSAVKVMRGTGTQQDIDNIINFNSTNIDIKKIQETKFKNVINALNESEDKLYAGNETEQEKLYESNKAEMEKKKAEADDYFSSLLGETGDTVTNDVDVNTNDNTNKNVLNSLDDIL